MPLNGHLDGRSRGAGLTRALCTGKPKRSSPDIRRHNGSFTSKPENQSLQALSGEPRGPTAPLSPAAQSGHHVGAAAAIRSCWNRTRWVTMNPATDPPMVATMAPTRLALLVDAYCSHPRATTASHGEHAIADVAMRKPGSSESGEKGERDLFPAPSRRTTPCFGRIPLLSASALVAGLQVARRPGGPHCRVFRP